MSQFETLGGAASRYSPSHLGIKGGGGWGGTGSSGNNSMSRLGSGGGGGGGGGMYGGGGGGGRFTPKTFPNVPPRFQGRIDTSNSVPPPSGKYHKFD